jgi:hypothetical protein
VERHRDRRVPIVQRQFVSLLTSGEAELPLVGPRVAPLQRPGGRFLNAGRRTPRCLGRRGESGRGLLLVAALAERWSVHDRVPVGKTVRAELTLPRRARR